MCNLYHMTKGHAEVAGLFLRDWVRSVIQAATFTLAILDLS